MTAIATRERVVRVSLPTPQRPLGSPGIRERRFPSSPAAAGNADADWGAGSAWPTFLPAADNIVGRLCAERPRTPIIFAYEGSRYVAPPQAMAETPILADGATVREVRFFRGGGE